ncbi:hypothetical protein M9H77_04346 [Catharanthus roseus]|uniref:Uncharacterized protein n=1 Tax=Catharanthus roseus TaxID=4058 RepID=A0ACC0CE92_CATRO|nr:hypothetical protein M9H77_04346 [Catharanthus roseus]
MPIKPGACAVTHSSYVATLKLYDRFLQTPHLIAHRLPHKENQNNNSIQIKFNPRPQPANQDIYCLVHLPEPVCPGVDGVGEGSTTAGAIIFGITRESSSLTQESVGRDKIKQASTEDLVQMRFECLRLSAYTQIESHSEFLSIVQETKKLSTWSLE